MNRIARLSENDRIRTASLYKTICESVFVEDRFYKTDEILRSLLELGIEFTPRSWRTFVENTMNLFIYEYVDKIIVGLQEGYKLTNDVVDIGRFLAKKRTQFLSLATNYNKLAKEMSKRNNMTFDMINWSVDDDNNK